MLVYMILLVVAGAVFLVALATFIGVCIYDHQKAKPRPFEVSVVRGMRDLKTWHFKKNEEGLAKRIFCEIAICPLAYIIPQGDEKTELFLYKEGQVVASKTLFGGADE